MGAGRGLVYLFAIAVFLGAFLLFLIQPLIGKYLLPWFGGGPGVWTACLLFFQTLLLAGYAYAHATTRWCGPRVQAAAHVGLLILALALLPIVPDAGWGSTGSGNPTGRILLLLTASIGAPYLVLSATGPLLQAWFHRLRPGVSPYPLYALSNAGSLLALLIFPFALEPALPRAMQALLWSAGFAGFALACAACAWCVARAPRAARSPAAAPARADAPRQPRDHAATGPQVTPARVLLWLLLPACGSVLLLSMTARMSEDVAAVPFLWVAALAAYLLSFIVAFQWPRLYRRDVFGVLLLLAPWILLAMAHGIRPGVRGQLLLLLLILFVCCMVCHGEVHRLRPPPAGLTGFYLAVAAGGALGGAFVSLLAPILFPQPIEMWLGLYGTLALLLTCVLRDPAPSLRPSRRRVAWLLVAAVALVPAYLLRRRADEIDATVVARARNFYGALSLTALPGTDGAAEFRRLKHGRITHGAQFFHPHLADLRRSPSTYYCPDSGAGLVLSERHDEAPRHVGVVGLGAGTLCAYARPGDRYRFYEINPLVERFAAGAFTYLHDARTLGAAVDVVPGDARLSLEREPPQGFDVLILDAFNGDAIPVHLLTAECFEVYARHVPAGGLILLHVSSLFLDLRPIVARLAAHAGWSAVAIDSQPDVEHVCYEAWWIVLARDPAALDRPGLRAAGAVRLEPGGARLWTDDHCSLFDALR
jgi:hypothetical protein